MLFALLNCGHLVASSGYAAIFVVSVLQWCCVPTSSALTLGYGGAFAFEHKLAEGHPRRDGWRGRGRVPRLDGRTRSRGAPGRPCRRRPGEAVIPGGSASKRVPRLHRATHWIVLAPSEHRGDTNASVPIPGRLHSSGQTGSVGGCRGSSD